MEEFRLLKRLNHVDAKIAQNDKSFLSVLGGGEFSILKSEEKGSVTEKSSIGNSKGTEEEFMLHSFIVMEHTGNPLSQFLNQQK